MIENIEKCNNNAEMENDTVSIAIESRIKYRWHQAINNAVCYYQTPFIIAEILEQVSNYNNLLREKISRDIALCARQNNMISNGIMVRSKLIATANECAPEEAKDKRTDEDSKVANNSS